MADEIVIETTSAEVIEVGVPGPQGPAGAAGSGLETLTTKGDTLYRGDTTGERLPIGSTGQVLKVSAQGIPTWANESGAVTSVNGATGAVTVAAATHAVTHEPGNEDPLQATAALVATDVVALNGVYFWDGTLGQGNRPNFYKTGTRKNTKLQYNSGNNQWQLVRNNVVEAVGVDGPDTVPWGNTWEDFVTPTTVSVTRLPLETMVQKLAETGGAATATTSEDGLMSSSDKTKLDGIAAGAEVNVNADWNATSGDAQILNKPSTFAPSAHSGSHAAGGSDPLFDQSLNSADNVTFNEVTTDNNLTVGGDLIVNNAVNIGDNGIDFTPAGATATIEYLGLGTAATADIGTGAGQVAEGNHTHTPSEVGLGNVSNSAQVTSVSGTAPIVSSGGTTPTISINAATTSAAGSMSSADKSKLDGIAAGAEVNVQANWTEANSGSDAFILNKPTLAAIATSGSASDLTTGTVATARLGTGTADNTTFLRGDGSWATPAGGGGGGISVIGASAADILSVSGSDLVADDPNADRIVFWDDSASKLTHLEVGSGLSISGTILTATGGGGSGGTKTYAVFTAEHNQPPATSFATLDTRGTGIAVLDFDPVSDESAVFVGIMPEGASLGSGLIVRLHWMATSATSGDVSWRVQFERSNTDLDSDSFATAFDSEGNAANGTSGILSTTAITVTDIDGITAGDVFRLRVTRRAGNVGDTMSGDAELVAVEVRSAA